MDHMKASSVLAAVCVAALTLTARTAPSEKLIDAAKLDDKGPEFVKEKLDTTKGVFVVEVHRDWSADGADRFYRLVKNGYFHGVKFFRVVPSFVVQWGIHGDPEVASKWLR